MIIGPCKYSKDPTIIPEGIAVTWSKGMIEDGYKSLIDFIRHFKDCMSDEEGLWFQKCKGRPKYDVGYVYFIYHGFVRYRAQFVGYETGETTIYDSNGEKQIAWSRIVVTGPMVKAPYKIKQKGFQGFRYTTKLF